MTGDRVKPIGGDSTTGLLQVVGTGLVLALLLVATRWSAAGSSWRQFTRLASSREALSLAYYDLVYVSALSGAFVGALLLARRRPGIQRMVAWLFVALAVLSVVTPAPMRWSCTT